MAEITLSQITAAQSLLLNLADIDAKARENGTTLVELLIQTARLQLGIDVRPPFVDYATLSTAWAGDASQAEAAAGAALTAATGAAADASQALTVAQQAEADAAAAKAAASGSAPPAGA